MKSVPFLSIRVVEHSVSRKPADVCRQCGEAFIPDEAAESLEKIVSKAEQNNIETEVVSYEKVA